MDEFLSSHLFRITLRRSGSQHLSARYLGFGAAASEEAGTRPFSLRQGFVRERQYFQKTFRLLFLVEKRLNSAAQLVTRAAGSLQKRRPLPSSSSVA